MKKALLTPFFAYEPNDLFAYETLPVSHPLKQLLFDWNDLARSRKWGLLFQSLMEDSGLLFREAESRDWDRKYTNYRQIFEYLETVAYRNNLDFRGLAALLDSYRKQTIGAQDDADIHQIETEEKKVQIMTMHVSKGLQFPVVFIAGGLTQPFADDYHVYHDYDPANPDAGSRKVIDLSKTFGKEQHDREKNDEDKRLYYVALTRAQFKLYVPFFPATSGHRWMGPVCRFLSAAIASAFPQADDNPALGWLDPNAPVTPGPDDAGTLGQEVVSENAVDNIPSSFAVQSQLSNPEKSCSNHSRACRQGFIMALSNRWRRQGFRWFGRKTRKTTRDLPGLIRISSGRFSRMMKSPAGRILDPCFMISLRPSILKRLWQILTILLKERRAKMSSSKQWMPTG